MIISNKLYFRLRFWRDTGKTLYPLQEAEKTSGLVSRVSEFSEEVEALRKQLLEKELELKEKDELLKRWSSGDHAWFGQGPNSIDKKI